MDSKTKGAWIIHHGQKLTQFLDPHGHDALEVASKAGLLLSSLCASQEQSTWSLDQVNALARVHGIRPLEQKALLDELAKAQLVDVRESGVSVLGVSTPTVLEHTASIYESQGPTNTNEASLELAESVAQEGCDLDSGQPSRGLDDDLPHRLPPLRLQVGAQIEHMLAAGA